MQLEKQLRRLAQEERYPKTTLPERTANFAQVPTVLVPLASSSEPGPPPEQIKKHTVLVSSQ